MKRLSLFFALAILLAGCMGPQIGTPYGQGYGGNQGYGGYKGQGGYPTHASESLCDPVGWR